MKRIHWILLLILLACIFLLEVVSIRHKTFTADEEDHYGYGWNILMLNADSRIVGNGTLMPFNSMNALPRLIGRQLPPGALHDFLVNLNTGRYVTILFSLLLAFYVFKWSKDLYGYPAGYFSLFLFAFSPNIIAHSRLITNDIFATCLMTMSLYYFWKFSASRSWKYATLTAVLCGISQVVKYTAVALFPIFLVILLLKFGNVLFEEISRREWRLLGKQVRIFVKYVFFFGFISLIIINIGFLFHGTFTPLREYRFRSLSWQNIQSQAGFLGKIPLPLPTLYLEGPDDRKWEEETGEHANNYLFGEHRNPGYFTDYFFWAYLYKVPFALQLFIFLSLIVYLKNRREYAFSKNEIFLWVPVLFFLVYLNFFLFIQSGIRFLIPAFPFLLVISGNLVKNWKFFRLRSRIGIAALSAYLVISVLSYFPHYLSYFNELVWDRKMAYKILADSNLEWGQNQNYLKKYLSDHPEARFVVNRAFPGRIVLRANDLVGIFRPREWQWLRENYEPVDHVAYTYLVYDITPEAIEDEFRQRNHLQDEDEIAPENQTE